MLQIDSLTEGLDVFKALGSDVRLKIYFLLAQQGPMNLNELADALKLTNGALTSHIKKLESCGLISVTSKPSGRGMQKICRVIDTSLLLNLEPETEGAKYAVYETQIEVGHYIDYRVAPECGMAGSSGLIGSENDTHVFSFPEHLDASMLWFHDGYVEYRIPNHLPENSRLVQLTLSFEVSSAEQGCANGKQEEIGFTLNDHFLGYWLSLDSPDQNKGVYTPLWWNDRRRRHGYLKMIVINNNGVFLDGVKIKDLNESFSLLDNQGGMRFRFSTTASKGGGIALYGNGSGNFNQAINVRVHYLPL